MKIIAIEREIPGTQADAYQPLLKTEAARVWELYQAETIRELYFTLEQHTAVLVLECESAATAANILGTLPLVHAGLITFDLLPLIPYSGFARLFEKEALS
jgi:hypothetical protein